MANRLVYSTDHGRMCPGCNRPQGECSCHDPSAPVGKGQIRLEFQTQGRKGRGVTVISGLPLTAAELTRLGKQLKKKCGTGGTVKNGWIEIQGDHRPLLLAELERLGWSPKK